MENLKTNKPQLSASIEEWNTSDKERPSAPIVEWDDSDEERPSAPIVEYDDSDEERPSAPIVEWDDSDEERPSAPIVELNDSQTTAQNSCRDSTPQDILGEYCAYCQYKIADYCKTHVVVDGSVKFCPNCGKPRITYRLDKQNK